MFALLAGSSGLLAGSSPRSAVSVRPAAAFGRRDFAAFAAAAAAAGLAAPAFAEQVLTMDADLSAPSEAPAEKTPAELESGFVAVLSAEEAKKIRKKTPAQRIKELEAMGGSKTDKEKKELKRLKAEEMCELLGKGC